MKLPSFISSAFPTPLSRTSVLSATSRLARSPGCRRAGGGSLVTTAPCMSAHIIIAPGQGAQTLGMLNEWVSASKAAADLVTRADAMLKDRLDLDTSLSELVRNGPEQTLSRTDIAQPAIYVASLACWAGLQDLSLLDPQSVAITAGLSLGEYTALVIAGAISFEDGLELVTLRGRAMQDAAEASSGSMLALLGADEADAATVVEAGAIDGKVLVAANFNAPGQVVLSGSVDCIERASLFASKELGLRVAKLDVAGAFHSPLMAPAADRLEAALASIKINPPRVPVMSNVTGMPHQFDSIRTSLVRQLTSPVRWQDCMNLIIADIQNAGTTAAWAELAPGKTLTGIMRKINKSVKVANYAVPPAVQAPTEA